MNKRHWKLCEQKRKCNKFNQFCSLWMMQDEISFSFINCNVISVDKRFVSVISYYFCPRLHSLRIRFITEYLYHAELAVISYFHPLQVRFVLLQACVNLYLKKYHYQFSSLGVRRQHTNQWTQYKQIDWVTLIVL